MLSVVRDQDGHQMDDRAWHQLRLRFSVKEMQESVQMVGKNFSKTSRELRTWCGRTFEDEFKRLKQLATKGGVYYFDCQVDIIVQLSTAHGLRPTCVGMVICEILTEDCGSSYGQDVKDIILSLSNQDPENWPDTLELCKKGVFDLELIRDDSQVEKMDGYKALLPIASNTDADESWSFVIACIGQHLSYSPVKVTTKEYAMARFMVTKADHPLIVSRKDMVRH